VLFDETLSYYVGGGSYLILYSKERERKANCVNYGELDTEFPRNEFTKSNSCPSSFDKILDERNPSSIISSGISANRMNQVMMDQNPIVTEFPFFNK
jgi:hypothetical protein